MNNPFRALSALIRPADGLPAAEQEPRHVTLSGNFLKVTGEDFALGQLRNLRLRDGALRLNHPGDGLWLSPVYDAQDFDDLVVSWNSDTPEGSWVELYARAFLPAQNAWTRWLSWGRWSTRIPRASVTGEDEYCWANSVPGYGDSSLNLREGFVGGAFQLKAVLHAEPEAACPALRLAAASFKRTADPNWPLSCSLSEPETPEPPAVLLDTPAFAQKARHPNYGGVNCSATCMAMLLCGRGEDLLPEDTTLLGFDYGYGGNGNWSFTTATAGAFGYESYVHYTSFQGLRQELSRGYALALSVKYSKDKDGKYPYWENGPCNTGGHIIAVVGYRYDEARGEYVYIINDPATTEDGETAHRDFPESQLDKAWYRRAAYFVHDKQADGADAQTRAFLTMRPVSGQSDCWALVDGERALPIPADFMDEPRKCFGHGTIFYTYEGDWRALPDGVRRMTGNLRSRYDGFSITEEGYLRFEPGVLESALGQDRTITVHVIANDGRAAMALLQPGAKPFSPGGEPAAMKAGKLWRWVLPVALVAAAAVALVRKKKK